MEIGKARLQEIRCMLQNVANYEWYKRLCEEGETYDLEFLMNIQESDIAFYPDEEDVEKIRLQAELCANADDEKDYKYQWLTIQRECSLLAFNLYKRHLRFTVPRERYYQRIIHKFYPDICGP